MHYEFMQQQQQPALYLCSEYEVLRQQVLVLMAYEVLNLCKNAHFQFPIFFCFDRIQYVSSCPLSISAKNFCNFVAVGWAAGRASGL